MSSPEDTQNSSEDESSPYGNKKRSSSKMLIIVVISVILLAGLGVGGYLWFKKKNAAHPPETEATSTSEQKKAEDKTEPEPESEAKTGKENDRRKALNAITKPSFYRIEDLLVNLSGDGKKQSLLKLKISLELADGGDAAKLDELKPRIIDSLQTYLRELRVDDLRGSAGLQRLREELLLRINQIVSPIAIKDVLFLEMLIP